MRCCAKIWMVGFIVAVAAPCWAIEEHEHAAEKAAMPAHLDPQRAANAAADMARAANNLLATYSDEQKKAGAFELTDEERVNWHFIPRTRKGIPFKDLSTAQRPLAHALLS